MAVALTGALGVGCDHVDDGIADAPGSCTPVDDGNECTADGCDGDQPNHTPRTGASCTGGGTCSAAGACSTNGVCGDGTTSGTEACDDNNTTPLDGCGPTCAREPTEVEPNEDGTPTEGTTTDPLGNDFDATAVANANANMARVPLDVGLGDAAVLAALMPAGDEDVFAVTNSSAVTQGVRFDVWNRQATFGYGASCGILLDVGMNIRDATGAVLASNDDRNASNDRCPGLDYDMAPGQRVYVHIVEFGDNMPAQAYGITMHPTPR